MFYGITTKATNFTHERLNDWRVRLLKAVLFFIPRANPDIESLYPLVKEWALELSEEGWPQREVGLDGIGEPLFGTPNNRNTGFWTDMAYKQFQRSELRAITEMEFEKLWLVQKSNRSLTEEEHHLARWMLEHGVPEAKRFVAQLEIAEVTPWRCPCGCASIHFQIKGHPEPSPGVHVLGDFLVGEDNSLSGIFIFESDGLLSGIELYGLAGDAPVVMPSLEELHLYEAGHQ
jgi:hypothetical protein